MQDQSPALQTTSTQSFSPKRKVEGIVDGKNNSEENETHRPCLPSLAEAIAQQRAAEEKAAEGDDI